MKIPKKIYICGEEWTIRRDKELSGGAFSTLKQEIVIGKSSQPKNYERYLLIHEIVEAILTMRLCRFDNYPDSNYMFFFDHRQLINICQDLMLALKDIFKE